MTVYIHAFFSCIELVFIKMLKFKCFNSFLQFRIDKTFGCQQYFVEVEDRRGPGKKPNCHV